MVLFQTLSDCTVNLFFSAETFGHLSHTSHTSVKTRRNSIDYSIFSDVLTEVT